MKRLLSVLLCAVLLLCTLLPACASAESPEVYTARPSVNGRLHVEGTQLVDQSGRPVQLRGVSTHGLSWYPEYISENLFRRIAAEWNCNMIRIAMYSVDYCNEKLHEDNLDLMRKGIEAAIAADVYVLVDWHILNDGNPNDNLDRAITFFDRIASSYPGDPAVLYEVCNEPNGVNWSDVLQYGYAIVPVIRQYSPEAVVVLGTPDYCADLSGPLDQPPPWENCLCAWHWYAGEHGSRRMLEKALEAGLPVMVSEWGVGKNAAGEPALEQGREFAAWLNEKGVSWCAWSLCNKDEVYSVLRPDCKKLSGWTSEDLSPVGALVFAALEGE